MRSLGPGEQMVVLQILRLSDLAVLNQVCYSISLRSPLSVHRMVIVDFYIKEWIPFVLIECRLRVKRLHPCRVSLQVPRFLVFSLALTQFLFMRKRIFKRNLVSEVRWKMSRE